MTGVTGLSFAPLVPWEAVAVLAAVSTLLLIFGMGRGARGCLVRLFVLAVLSLGLLNPHLESESRDVHPDIALVVVDGSSSQNAGKRPAQRARAVAAVRNRLAKFDDLEVRMVEGRETAEGTLLFGPLRQALADLPRGRYAGSVFITDGQVHDMPTLDEKRSDGSAIRRPELDAPLHVLLTGQPDERDRRLIVEKSPAFGIVGKKVTLKLRIEDQPSPAGRPVGVAIRVDGGEAIRTSMPVGTSTNVEVPLDHGGNTIIELEADAMRNEISLVNNRAVVTVNGVRDRLQVLLVSGQPHLGERTWRNLLKSDPSIDLVHFTILRPPGKSDFTPLNELALISFPIRELFEIKLKDFDLIVFDRYVLRYVLPLSYFQNIATYVRNGGAVLASVGPEFANIRSIYNTPLGDIFPAQPSGPVIEDAFRPMLTARGRRHPVTAGLPGDNAKTPNWGRWYRQVEAVANRGQTLMTGSDEQPLLILDRVGKGRIAQFMSDHIWLWARGFDGGGPHAELMRRTSHWLMQEPDLEEEDLRASVEGNRLTIQRRSLDPAVPPVTVTSPSGAKKGVTLTPAADGSAKATVEIMETGLYQIEDGRRRAMAAAGRLNPPEFADLRASAEPLLPVVKASGGGTAWIAEGLPDLRRTRPERRGTGAGWFGLQRNGAFVVTGVRQTPLLPALVFLLLVAGGVMLSWWREGKY